jgi:hypothetical protein
MRERRKRFALCLNNTDHEASLIVGKVYSVLSNPKATKDELVRIVDESGEDYLYHRSQFAFVDFPKPVERKILALQAVA